MGRIAYLDDMVVRVRQAEGTTLCKNCVFSTKNSRNALDCPYHRACMSPFRPDRESVVFGKM